jgi:hypothetical protein
MSIIAEDPHNFAGQRVANGHCVRYVQECSVAGHTRGWRRGAKVRGSGAEPGTVIATFDGELYANRTDGSSHAAILIAEEDDGLRVWDQWVGHPVAQRLIRFRGGQGKPVNDADRFCVVEVIEMA